MNASTLSGCTNSITALLFSLLTLIVRTVPQVSVIELMRPNVAFGGKLVIMALADLGTEATGALGVGCTGACTGTDNE